MSKKSQKNLSNKWIRKRRFIIKDVTKVFSVLCLFFIMVFSLVILFNRYTNKSNTIEEFKQELITTRGSYDEQQVILENTNKATAQEIASRLNAKLRISKDGKFAALTLPKGTTIVDVVNNKKNEDMIGKFSIDYQVSTSELEEVENKYLPKPSKVIPGDEFYNNQTYLDYLNLSNIWEFTKGENITIAVIDTGIDTNHHEFEGKISEYSYNATEDKIVKDYLNENGEYDWSLIEDEEGHGTAVTGVIAASWNNGGIVGIAPDVNIITIKAECDEKGNFKRTSDLVFGLYYAIERDVDIVNMSFGGSSNVFSEATKLAVDSDIICVAAAGNNSSAELTYPAADPNVIGVGALDSDSFELAYYSNFGENTDVVAPGTTYTTKIGGGYDIMNGTSFASPIVVAAIALQKSYDKSYRCEDYQEFSFIQELLYASSKDLGDLGQDFYYGYGTIDLSALVLEERKTVTFNYLTDEIEETKQLFIKNHPLQNIPEPERLYVVFDGWYYDIHCFEEYNLYSDIWQNDITLYCNWGNEDDVLPYTYVELDDGTIEIRSYTGKRKFITVPEYIDGKVVSSIGKDAFANQTKLRVINLPKQLTIIKDNAFYNCNNLTSITIPDTVITIGSNAFYNNIRIFNINFGPNSKLEIINNKAFANCSNLVRIDLPENVIFSEYNDYCTGNAFIGCTNLKQINAHKNSKYFSTNDGVLYNKSKTTLVAYPAGLKDSTYDIPMMVSKLGISSFAYSNIESLDLKNIIIIDSGAFQYSKIENVLISDSVTAIGEKAFSNSSISSIILGRGIKTISAYCFYNTSNLKDITIPNSIVEIEYCAFAYSNLENILFEEGSSLQIIGAQAFSYTNINNITIPNSVLFIGSRAFLYSKLTNLNILEDSKLVSIGDYAFYLTSISNVYLPKGLTTLGAFSFSETNIMEVIIPNNVINYSPNAFASCHYLKNIYIENENQYFIDIDGVVYTRDLKIIYEYPAGRNYNTYTIEMGVEKIGEYAFYGAWNLTDVILPNSLIEIGEYGFYDCLNIVSYELPQLLQIIQRYAFAENKSLASISIPDNVIQISNRAFMNNYSMYRVYLSDNSKLDRLSYEAFSYCGIYSFRVPSNVSTISQNVFIGCKKLNSITFAANSKLESISAYLFKGCDNLKNISFEEGSLLTNIQAHAFEGITNLRTINFGNAKIINIDNFAFRYCESLQDITIPNTVEYIGRYAFFGCESLNRIDIPSSVEYIGRYAFNMTNELDVYFENTVLPLYIQENWDYGIRGYYLGVKEIYTDGDYELAKLTNDTIAIIKYNGDDKNIDLTSLNFGVITQIGGSAFKYSSIESITLPETLVVIDSYAFANTNLKTINIPSSVIQIGDSTFRNSKIENVNFESGSNIKRIDMYAFANTLLLKTISIPESLLYLGSYAFYESGLEEIIFDEHINLQTINESTFQKSKLINITIPNSVNLIDHNAFRDISTLETVNFGTGRLQIMSNVFYNTSLISVYIPGNVEYIGEYAFVGLKKLNEFIVDENNKYYASKDGVLYSKDYKNLISFPGNINGTFTIPSTVEEISFGAFENSKLSTIYFDENINLLTLGYRAFYNSSIESVTLPKTLVSIDYYAFAMCKNLHTVEFNTETKLTGIYEGAFYGCINLQNIVLPSEILEISDYAFYGCLKLEKLPVAQNAKILCIFDYAFANTGIIELNLPETLLDIGNYAFQGIKAKEIVVPSTNQSQLIIGLGAFNECNQLETITLPFIGASLDNEEYGWFGYIFGAGAEMSNNAYIPNALKKVTITYGQTVIARYAFRDITSIDEIIFPHSIIYVKGQAFSYSTIKYTLTNTIIFESESYKDYLNMVELGKGIYGTLKLGNSNFSWIRNTYHNINNLEKIILPDNVTVIDMYAFEGCTSLTSITIPDSVTSIGDSAFNGCTSLTSITIPDSVTSIGDGVFNGCTSLTNITIPDSVTSIGYNTFNGCTSLTSITIPDSVTSIGYGAFYGCYNLVKIQNNSVLNLEIGSLENGEIAKNAVVIINKDGSLECRDSESGEIVYVENDFIYIEKETIYLLQAYIGNEETITLPLEFNDKQVMLYNFRGGKNVIIPDGYTTISENSFNGCTSLTSIIIPDSVTEIDDNAFINCKSLTSITIPDSVLYIGEHVFEGCTGLTNITIPDSVKKIGNFAFNGCTSLRSIIIPDSVKNIGNFAFIDCTSLTSITIPDSVISIEGGVFSGCTSLTSITIPDSVISIEGGVFSGCTSLTSITIPDSVTIIGGGAFSGCTNLLSIELPEGLSVINESTFSNCISLTSITIPDSVTDILDCAFEGCYSLLSVELPLSLEKIDFQAFIDCNNLNTVYINDKLIYIEENVFSNIASIEFIIENNMNFSFIDGVLFDINEMNIVYLNSNNRIIELPNGIKSISNYLFAQSKNLENVIIPDSVVYIGEHAFEGCTGLTNITIPDSVTNIGNDTFNGCTSLTSITIPDSVTSIGDAAFSGCTSLKSITIPDSVTSIGYAAFSGCTSLTSIIIPVSVTSIGYNAFKGCTSLTSITIPDSVTSIGDAAFSGCTSLTSITIPDSVTSIGDGAFYGCTNLTSITIPDSVTSIGGVAFSGCTNLQSIELPEGLSVINESTFSNCISLTSITIPDSVTSIGGVAFSGCTNLQSIELPEGLSVINESTFSNCISLTSITIPDSVTSIGGDAFYGCYNLVKIQNNSVLNLEIESSENGEIAKNAFVIINKDGSLEYRDSKSGEIVYVENDFIYIEKEAIYLLQAYIGNGETITLPLEFNDKQVMLHNFRGGKNVIIPDGYTAISENAFNGCTSLASIIIPDSVTSIGYGAFSGCTNLQSIELPEGLSVINKSTFSDCISLTSIIIPDNVTEIDNNAFINCTSLTSITIPDSVTSIGYGAFWGCTNLQSITIPDSVTIIEDGAFTDCTNLKEIEFSKNLKYIGYSSLSNLIKENPDYCINGNVIVDNVVIYLNPNSRFYFDSDDIFAVMQESINSCYYLELVEISGIKGEKFNFCTNIKTFIINDVSGNPFLYQYFSSNPSSIPETLENVVLGKSVKIDSIHKFTEISNINIFVDQYETEIMWDHDFPGWNNGNKVFYKGEWIKTKFYDDQNNLISQEYYLTSQVIKQPIMENYVKDGYTYSFVGWDIDDDGIADSYPATSNIDIEANAVYEKEINTYEVTYYDKDNFTILYKQDYLYGEIIELIETPIKIGYTFIEWINYPDDLMVKNNIDIYSLWKHNGDGHIYEKYEVIPPSCEEKGYTKHICSICNEWYASDYVDALDHQFEHSKVEPTCESDGYDLFICLCGYSYKDNYVNSFGHIFDEWIIDLDSTCEFEGNKHRKCWCGFEENEVIEVKEHQFISSIVQDSNCTQTGSITYTCSECGNKYEDEIPLKEHNYQKKYVEISWIQKMIQVVNNLLFGYEGDQIYYLECMCCGNIKIQESSYDGTVSIAGNCQHYSVNCVTAFNETCSEEGAKYNKCSNCEHIFEFIIIPATGHTYETKVTLPTCEEQGYTTYTCHCGDTYVSDYVDSLGHTEVIDEAVDATCVNSGLTEGSHCSVCNKVLKEQLEVPATGHTYETKITLPTCEEQGYTTYTCHCGDTYVSDYVDSLGHTEVIDEAVDATCVNPGLTEGSHCSVCNKVLKEQLEVPATGHTYETKITLPTCEEQGYTTYTCHCGDTYVSDYVDSLGHTEVIDEAVDATCVNPGLTEGSHCSVCNKVLKEQLEVPATGHTYEAKVTLPTCEEQGYTTYICHCGDTYVSDYVDSLGHTEVIDEAVDATCVNSGLTEGSHCSVCNKVLKEQLEVPATGHTYETKITLPTCEEQGYTTYTCHCGDTYVSDYVDSLGHTEVIDEAVDATCVNPGLTEGSHCSVCNKVLIEQLEVPATGHTYGTKVTLPTCEEQGYTTYTCHCGDTYVSDYVDSLGHTEVIDEAVDATCVNSGLTEGSHCSVCNKVLKEQLEVPATGHTYGTKVTLPTCEEQGYTTYTCHCGDTYVSDYVDSLGHTEVIDEAVDATCVNSGLTEGSHCSVCNKVLKEQLEVPATGHTYETKVTLPTCEEQGYTTYTCHCGDTYVSDYVDSLGHTEVIDEAVDATCVNPGLTEGSHCSVCNKVLKEQLEVPATGHTYEAKVTLPTCEEQGYTTYICHCGDTYVSDYVDSLGHAEVIDEAVDATCVNPGLTEGSHCSVCNKVLKEQLEVPATGHTYETKVTLPTCEEQGYTTYTCHCGDTYVSDYVDSLGHTEVIDEAVDATCVNSGLTEGSHCSVCNKVLKEQLEVPATGHTYETKVTLPTCEEQGYTTYTCHCGDTYVSDYVDSLGHTEVIDEAVDATCVNSGLTEGSHCSVCNKVLKEQLEVPATGHTYETKITLPTCEEQGYTTYTCHCGDTYVSDYVDSLGHTEVIDEAVDATCVNPGLTEGSHCSVCNKVLKEQLEVPATDHTYETKVTLPTCEEQGYTTYTCHCGDTYVSDYVDSLGHTEVIDEAVDATCVNSGLTEGSHCSVCNKVLKEQLEVPATGHTYETKVTLPTCEEQGYTTYTCHCGDTYVSDYVDSLGHTEVIDEAVDATCVNSGLTEGSHCSVCNKVLKEQLEVPATGHTYETKVTLPTCEEQGYTTYTCHCGDTYVSDYVEALGHTESDWIIDKDPTKKEKGIKHTECIECRDIIQYEEIQKVKSGCRKNDKYNSLICIFLLSSIIYLLKRRR